MLSRQQLHGLLIILAHSDLTYLCLQQTQSGATAVGLLDVALAVIATRLWRLMWQHYEASASASASASGNGNGNGNAAAATATDAASQASDTAACAESRQISPHHWDLTDIQALLVELPQPEDRATTVEQTQTQEIATATAALLQLLSSAPTFSATPQPATALLLAEREVAPLNAPNGLLVLPTKTRQQNGADTPSPDLGSAWYDYYLPDQLLQTVECYLDLQLQRQLHPESLIRYRRF